MRLHAFLIMLCLTLRIRAYSLSGTVSTRGFSFSPRVINRRLPLINASSSATEKYPFLTYTTPNSGPTPRLSFSTSNEMGSISPATSAIPSASKIGYWNMNVPQSEWTTECPAFLQNMGPRDIEVLSTPQDNYKLMTWETLSQYVADNRLDIFQRTPLDLRKYRAFNYKVIQQYGSIMNFIQTVKLKWPSPIVPKGKAFEYEEDICVQFNDWPYGIEKEVIHLVVWTKFSLEETGEEGDLSDAERKRIDDFVEERFRKPLGAKNVLWFRNWAALKSVHSIEHFHVMLRNPTPEFLDEVTHGDVPMYKRREFGGRASSDSEKREDVLTEEDGNGWVASLQRTAGDTLKWFGVR